MSLDDIDLGKLERNLPYLPPEERQKLLDLLEQRDRLAKLNEAREHFLPFVKQVWPDFIPGAHHTIMAEAFERVAKGTCTRLIINMPPRHRLALDTPIATTEGWKTMASVEPGDYVFSPSGAPVRVTGKSPVYEEDLFAVETTDGQIIECDATHLWSVRWGGTEREHVTMPTVAIMDKADRENWNRNNNPPKLPRVQPVEYPERNLLIPPYVLGAWLGDGAAASGTMAAHPDDAAWIRARFEASGIETNDLSTPMIFGTKTLRIKLRDIGVLHDKHIPEEYLTACTAQRLALLQGLMDTDGTVSKAGKCTFHNSNLRLMEDVLELVHSFGLKARITSRQTHYKQYVSKPSYRLSFKMADAASLPRKAQRCRAISGNWSRAIHITPTGRRGMVQCLEVENEDGLFLAGRGYVPTHNTKSELTSWLLPAWFLGKFPKKKIIQASNTENLAAGFGRRVRNLIDGEDLGEDEDRTGTSAYQNIFPGIRLAKDSKAAAGWHTNRGGEYFAIGVNGKVAGKGGDIVIIDDPHSEQEAKQAESNPAIFDAVYDWYNPGPRQRLQPGGAIIIVMTRWSKRDLTGRVLKKMQEEADNPDTDKWEVIEFPAILDEGTPAERSLWPGYWPLKTLKATKSVMPVSNWQAQYMQEPTSEGAAIIKREYWRKWGVDSDEDLKLGRSSCPAPQHARAWANLEPPACNYIIGSWDCAATKNERSHPSAYTLWGVFTAEDPTTGKTINNIILLSSYKARLEFPALKKKAKQFYDEDRPDTLLIENKSAGMQLIQEFRAMNLPVEDFSGSSRGTRGVSNDKIARANSVSDVFASRYIWAPERRFAEEVIEQCAEFPNGAEDDLVDSTVQAMIRFRTGGFIRTANDETDDDEDRPRARRKRYY